ncbi:TPA: DNA repair protein [Streptococcus suis]|nr:DNA repair protein [Streptococcus suis]
MADKELKKLKRLELLEILLAQSKEIERLTERVAELEKALADRQIVYSSAGTLAEAALGVTAIFEEAQKAANLYLENIERKSVEIHEESQ